MVERRISCNVYRPTVMEKEQCLSLLFVDPEVTRRVGANRVFTLNGVEGCAARFISSYVRQCESARICYGGKAAMFYGYNL